MNKQKEFERIAQEIEKCTICKEGTSGKAVAGEGSADAEIVFLGEAPGRTEAATGRPFVGRSGKLLRQLINEVGLREEDIYITSPVKYLPDRGTPTPAQVAHGKTHLDKQLAIIKPRVIVLLGATASLAMFGKKLPVLKEHGKTIKENGRTYFLALHPAAAIRFQKFRKLFEEDFRRLKNLL